MYKRIIFVLALLFCVTCFTNANTYVLEVNTVENQFLSPKHAYEVRNYKYFETKCKLNSIIKAKKLDKTVNDEEVYEEKLDEFSENILKLALTILVLLLTYTLFFTVFPLITLVYGILWRRFNKV